VEVIALHDHFLMQTPRMVCEGTEVERGIALQRHVFTPFDRQQRLQQRAHRTVHVSQFAPQQVDASCLVDA